MTSRRKRRRRGRGAAVLLGLLLGSVLAVTPAVAQSGERAVYGHRQPTAVGSSVRADGAQSVTTAEAARVRHTTSTHRVAAAQVRKEKAKKKAGFFKKFGIFLLVVVIVVILFVILLIWLLVRAVRRFFGRRRV
ncbi:hypothetical protein [Streptomyces sp. TP-A0356]|uniref:hypothetical protein n=1 Tax=Streptomyces sp. TP-A0356 TaxID=1359208 RepID=UPI001F1A6646|nr:hypothetical protein [Streptomyces sp. TP-A0356]